MPSCGWLAGWLAGWLGSLPVQPDPWQAHLFLRTRLRWKFWLELTCSRSRHETTTNLNAPPIDPFPTHRTMRRLPRLRAPAPAGFVPSQIPAGALRAPAAAAAAAAITASSSTSTPRLNNRTQGRRYLSTTPIRPSQQQQQQPQTELAAEEEFDEEYYPLDAAEIPTQLVYPHSVSVAAPPAEVADPAYTPAESADGLEEVGGLGDWWDQPTHWGSEGGAAQFVRDVVSPFGPAERVTDPAMLEVLGKRAIVEALVVAKFAGPDKKKAIDRLFAHAEGTDRLGKIVRAEVVAGKNGSATLKTQADWRRVWDVLKSSVKMARPPQQVEEGQAAVEGQEAAAVEAEAEAAVPEAEVSEVAPAPQLTPLVAKSMMGSWNKGWKKAELRDPVVKFFVSSPSG